MQNIALTNNSRTAWPTQILNVISEFWGNLLQDAHIIFQKSFDK